MKKRMSRILSALLVSALVMSAGNVVQAEDGGASATGKAKVEAEVIPQDAAGVKEFGTLGTSDDVKEITAKATVNGRIPLNKIVTGKENPANHNIGNIVYYNTSAYKKGGNNQYGYAEPVSLNKGILALTVAAAKDSTSSVWFGLYKDAGLTRVVDGYTFVTKGNEYTRYFYVPTKGTYYIGVYSTISSSVAAGTGGAAVLVRAVFFDGSDRTLTSGKQVAVGVNGKQTNYFKFKVKKAGYITVPLTEDQSARYCKVTLCNSKKKALTNEMSLGGVYTNTLTYGVKKGTYYIRVKYPYSSKEAYTFKVTSNSSIKEKSGKTKAKAVTLKKGKKGTKKGTLEAGSGQADWYKFKRTNKNKATVTVEGKTNDKIKVTLYRGGKKIGTGTFSYMHKGYKFTMPKGYAKGTYYIKIERGSKKSSGWYSVNWK